MFNDQPEILGVELDCPACKKAQRASERISVARVIEKLDGCFAKNDLDGARRLVEYWQKEAEALGDLSGELSIVNEMLGLYRKTGEKDKAEAAISRALVLLDETETSNSVSGATVLINAATTSKAFGGAEQALPLYERALTLYKNDGVDENDARYAALYNNYATALSDLKRFEDAEGLYQRALKITSASVATLLDCAVTYVNMAHLYEDWGEETYEKIEGCLVTAERIFNDERIKRDSYYAFVAEKCAPSFDYFGYFAFARELRTVSREIYERA